MAYIGYIEQGQRHGTLATYVSIVGALGYTLNNLTSDRPVCETSLAIPEDNARALIVCEEEERETILRIIREMTALLRRN